MKKGWPRLLKNVTDDLTGDGIRRQIIIDCFVTCVCMHDYIGYGSQVISGSEVPGHA